MSVSSEEYQILSDNDLGYVKNPPSSFNITEIEPEQKETPQNNGEESVAAEEHTTITNQIDSEQNLSPENTITEVEVEDLNTVPIPLLVDQILHDSEMEEPIIYQDAIASRWEISSKEFSPVENITQRFSHSYYWKRPLFMSIFLTCSLFFLSSLLFALSDANRESITSQQESANPQFFHPISILETKLSRVPKVDRGRDSLILFMQQGMEFVWESQEIFSVRCLVHGFWGKFCLLIKSISESIPFSKLNNSNFEDDILIIDPIY